MLYAFPGGAQGSQPKSGVTLYERTLYGEAGGGASGKCYYDNIPGCGLIFKMPSPGKLKIVYTFKGGKSGGNPQGGLLAYKGNFYGTTAAGGGKACMHSDGCGTAFEMTPFGTKTTLHMFGRGPYDGALPVSGLVFLTARSMAQRRAAELVTALKPVRSSAAELSSS